MSRLYYLILVTPPVTWNLNTPGPEEGVEFDDFLDDEQDSSPYDITPGEFAQLKRLHGGDPFPVTNSFEVRPLAADEKALHPP